jgi:fructose-1,6-bisphosphatase/inositol monophosphatase family enzyme
VTGADVASQEAILQFLLECGLQDATIRAEEDTPSLRRFRSRPGAPTVFVDPIDGTLAYSMGCPDWESRAADAGFEQRLLQQTKEKVDPRCYGIVLGALIPETVPIAIGVLPELQITYHAINGLAFRNGARFQYSAANRPSRVAIGRRLLDPSGESATPFVSAHINVRWFSGSSPAVLWHIFEGACTGYADLSCGFDAQLTAVIAQACGLLVSDRYGAQLKLDLNQTIDSIVYASSTEERDRVCNTLQTFR